MDSQNLFFGLGSVLIIIILLSVLGVLGNSDSSSPSSTNTIYTHPSYWRAAPQKTVVISPDYYIKPNPYRRRYYN